MRRRVCLSLRSLAAVYVLSRARVGACNDPDLSAGQTRVIWAARRRPDLLCRANKTRDTASDRSQTTETLLIISDADMMYLVKEEVTNKKQRFY